MFLPQLGFEWVVLWTIVISTLIYTVFYYHLLLFSLLQYCCDIRLFNWYRFNQKIMCFIREYCLKTGFLAKYAYQCYCNFNMVCTQIKLRSVLNRLRYITILQRLSYAPTQIAPPHYRHCNRVRSSGFCHDHGFER